MSKLKDIKFIIIAVIFALLIILPFLPLIFISISINYRWPAVFPSEFSIRAIKYVFYENTNTYEAVINTLVIGISVIIIDFILAIPAAMSLERYEFKGKTVMKMLLFAPIIVPPFTAIMGMYTIFIKLGLTESILGVILAHILPTLPYMIKAMMVSFNTLNTNLEDQASILGASSTKRFYYIILPHLLPSILAGASLTFLISASQYFLTLLVGGGKVATLTILMIPFINGGDKAIGSVYSLIFSIVALINISILDFGLKAYYKKKNFQIL
ncbi:ABC transporter permease [Candidatus Clostridium stratigraminis]|uniref:ABC transporter permease n=1 Tax=Candidatus Clostridium stratigraminis TaxID=3381661 RepID=A0ABW8SZ28_9CLOT